MSVLQQILIISINDCFLFSTFTKKITKTEADVTKDNVHVQDFFAQYNYANPVYGAATMCHQVRWLRWGHLSLFHTATSLLI